MSAIANKIDFAAIVSATRSNINGDPLNGNRPRQDYNGYGIFSDVAIKRKIRNRLQDMGEYIFVQSNGRENDMAFDKALSSNYSSLKDRAEGDPRLAAEIKKGKNANAELFAKIACEKWIDVRAFGQVFAFKKEKDKDKTDKKAKDDEGREETGELSVGIRGPVSIQQGVSVAPIDIIDMQITKSVNSEAGKKGKASDTMGTKHYVDFGIYLLRGSINCQLAEKTGFTENDAEKIKEALLSLFENDASSARPEGSLQVQKVFWWKHNNKHGQYPSAKVFDSLHVNPDGSYTIVPLGGLEPQTYDGR